MIARNPTTALFWLMLIVATPALTGSLRAKPVSGNLHGGCLASVPLPGDAAPVGTFILSYGTCALTSKWLNGKLFDVVVPLREVSGSTTASASWAVGAATITVESCPAGKVGAVVSDRTVSGQLVGYYSSCSGTTLVLQSGALVASSGSRDAITTFNTRTVTIRAINGYPDVRTLANLMDILPSCPNGSGRPSCIGGLPVSKIYDQSGNGNDCTQAVGVNRLAVQLIDGEVYLAGDGMLTAYVSEQGKGNAVPKSCSFPATLSIDSQAWADFSVVQMEVSGNEYGYGSHYTSPIFTVGTSIGAGFSISTGFGSSNLNWGLIDWDGSAALDSGLPIETQSLVQSASSSASSLTILQNEEASAILSAVVKNTATGGELGAFTGVTSNGAFWGRMQGFMLANSSMSAEAQSAVRRALYARFGICPTQKYNFLIDGASVDNGTGSFIGGIQSYGWADQLRDLAPYCIRMGNTAVYGASVENLTTNFLNSQAKFYNSSYAKNILIGPGGALENSLASGDTPAQAYAAFQNWLAAAVTAGWSAGNIYVYLLGPGNSEVRALNNSIISGQRTGGYRILNMGGNPGVAGCPVNKPMRTYSSAVIAAWPQYFNAGGQSNGHPTVMGYNFFARCFLPQVIEQAIGANHQR